MLSLLDILKRESDVRLTGISQAGEVEGGAVGGAVPNLVVVLSARCQA